MRNLDSCRCWRCTLCPCKVRNKFLVNFWNRTILLCIPCIDVIIENFNLLGNFCENGSLVMALNWKGEMWLIAVFIWEELNWKYCSSAFVKQVRFLYHNFTYLLLWTERNYTPAAARIGLVSPRSLKMWLDTLINEFLLFGFEFVSTLNIPYRGSDIIYQNLPEYITFWYSWKVWKMLLHCGWR